MIGNANTDPYDSDRGIGFLSKGDRDYLIDGPDPEWKASTEKTKRHRIRERSKNAIRDFTLLLNELDLNDRAKIQSVNPADACAFLVQPSIRRAINTPDWNKENIAEHNQYHSKQYQKNLLASICSGIFTIALNAEYPSRDYEVSIPSGVVIKELDGPKNLTVGDLEQQLQNDEISPEEIRQYYGEGWIDYEVFKQLTRDKDLLDPDLTDERRRELLNKSLPVLEEENPDTDN